MDENNKREPTFEEALARLEKIVASLEEGKAPLDSSLSLFEEGTRLVRLCTAKIDAAEQRVKKLSGTPENLTEEDF